MYVISTALAVVATTSVVSLNSQPWFTVGASMKACTSALTSNARGPRDVPTDDVLLAFATTLGWLFHLTVLCSHEPLMRCTPWMRAWLGLFASSSVSVAALIVAPPGMPERSNWTRPRLMRGTLSVAD